MNVPIFIAYGVVFFAILVIIGIVTKKWAQEASDFALAGREVGFWISLSGLMAIAFAGTSLSLAPAFAISHGFLGALAWGGCLALGFAVYGLIFGKMMRRCGAQTLSEWMETRFSGSVRTLTSIGTIVGLCGIMANNIASFASSLSVYANIPTWVSIAICFAIIVLFTYCSGMHAVNITNLFQMLIGAIALPLFAALLASKFGGVNYITENWPAATSWFTHGMSGLSLPVLSIKYPSLLTFVLMNGIFLIWGSNYYYVRAACCRSEKVVKRSFVWSGVAQLVIVYIPLIFVGLYGATAFGDQFTLGGGTMAPAATYGFMLFNLAAAVASFMLIASMAASLSTASTALMGATSTGARDIYQRNFKPNATPKQMLMPNRIIMVVLGIFTCVLCFFPGGPTYLFAFANSWMGPPAILLVLGAFWKKFSPKAAFWSVLCGMIAMAVFTILELAKVFVIGDYMHLCIVGLGVTLIVGIIVTLFTEPKYFGKKGWVRDPKQGQRENIKLESSDVEILSLIRNGFTHMVEIVDYLGQDSRFVSAGVERLDRGGYIVRSSLSGAGFYELSITEKGEKELPALSLEEQELRKVHLTPAYRQYLLDLKVSEDKGVAYLREQGCNGLQITAINSMLERYGYVGQKGHLRRHYYATQAVDSIR